MTYSQAVDLSLEASLSKNEYADCIISGELPADYISYTAYIQNSSIQNASFTATKHVKLKLADVQVQNSSFVGTNLSEGTLDNITFAKCRITGSIFSEGTLSHCKFTECAINMALFRFTSLKNVIFENCNLQGSDFFEAKLTKVTFTQCNLYQADFSRCTCNNVDLRTSELVDIKGIANLKGSTISSQQLFSLAGSLAQALEIVVKE